MSRSGYVEDMDDQWAMIRWRGAVNAALRGARGQAFLREMLSSLDALPEKKLVHGELQDEDGVCAIGAVGRARGTNMSAIDQDCPESVGRAFGIARAMAAEIEYENDDWRHESDAHRFVRMRKWVTQNLVPIDKVNK